MTREELLEMYADILIIESWLTNAVPMTIKFTSSHIQCMKKVEQIKDKINIQLNKVNHP